MSDDTSLFDTAPAEPEIGSLTEKFIAPPFSVLDARQGYWKARKQSWLDIGIVSEVGRGLDQASANYRSDYGLYDATSGQAAYDPRKVRAFDLGGSLAQQHGNAAEGVSVFDPVLCELAYTWWCPPGGLVLDPFAGGSVRGIVAARLGRRYVGIDLRPEQVAANNDQADALLRSEHPRPLWITGDARNVQKLVGQGVGAHGQAVADFVFTCPPYYDLEVYSTNPADLSNCGTYREFAEAMAEVAAGCAALLRQDRFAAVVIGEVRDKRGNYYGLVPDTIAAFRAAGMALYNEAVLVTPVGTLPMRTSAQFPTSRKLGKGHQNVLVFVKGDGKAAAAACAIEIHQENMPTQGNLFDDPVEAEAAEAAAADAYEAQLAGQALADLERAVEDGGW